VKIFNISLAVRITSMGELRDPQPSMSDGIPTDSPIKDVAKLFDRLQSSGAFPGSGTVSGQEDAVSMTENIQICAGSFEELQSILAEFHKTAQRFNLSLEGERHEK